MTRKITLLIFFLSLLKFSAGQEPHFSLFYQNPTHLNPALTGLNECIMRMGGIYRDQWRTVSKPYRTYSFFADGRIQPYEYKHDAFGVGLLFIGDKAGTANLSTNDVKINFAYHKGLIKDNRLIISIGLSFGLINHSLKSDQLFFGNQWTGNSFDPALANNEPWTKASATFFDAGAGLLASIYFTDYTVLSIGGGLKHFTFPSYSFMGGEYKVPLKTDIHIGLNAAITQRTIIQPKIYYSRQGGAYEAVMGFNVTYVPAMSPIYMGIWYRWMSDVTPVIGMQIKGFDLMVSYDVSISRLNPVSKYHGGFEVSLVKSFLCEDPFYKTGNHGKDGRKSCPIF